MTIFSRWNFNASYRADSMSYPEDWQRLMAKQPDVAELTELIASSIAPKVPKEQLISIARAQREVLELQTELTRLRREHTELAAAIATLKPGEVPQTPRPSSRREQQLQDLLSGLIAVSGADFSRAADLQVMMSDMRI